jgi:hypothetical protein
MAFLLFSTDMVVPKSKRTLSSGLPPGPELVFLSMNHLKRLVISAIVQ